MQRRSQGNNELAEFHPDITALERSNRRGANRGSAQSMEGNRMEHGEGSGEGNAAFTQSVPVAGGNVEPRMHNSPVRRHTQTQDRRDDENGDNVRIGTFDEPWARPARTGIVVPRIPANNFEMKQGLMNAVRNLQFHGRPSDNPLDHLDTFDRICSIYKVGNVPLNTIRMMMFPFSLADGATVWEREIPSDLVSNWEDVKKEFLKAFFPKQKTAKIREEIVSFKQRSHESFAQAWDRMKRYIRACPHHGFSRDSILGIFYRGCDASNRMYLDSASGGCFADNTVKNGESIIANLARSSGQGFDEDDDYDRDDGSAGADSKGLKEMHRKLDLVLKGQINRKEVSFVREAERAEERTDAEFDYDEEINYVDNNQGFQNRGYSGQGFNSNGGQPFRSNYGVQGTYPLDYDLNKPRQLPPQSTESDIILRLGNLIKRATEENAKLAEATDNMLVNMVGGLESRIDAWECRMTCLDKRIEVAERQIADVTKAAKYEEEGQNYCQLVDDTSQKRPFRGHVYYVRDVSEDEIIPYVPPLPFPATVQIAEKQKADYDNATAALKIIEESPESKELMQCNSNFRDHREKLIACKKWFEKRTGYYGLENPYPSLKFPYHHFSSYLAALSDTLTVGTDKAHVLQEETEENTAVFPEIWETKIVTKREDPGCFAIPCSINGEIVDDCVLDLGASKSVMPLHLSRTLALKCVEETDTSIVLADWTTIKPAGFAQNVPIAIHGHIIPTDFLIVDTGSRKSKVILGRPFLSSVGAEIKVREKRVIFNIPGAPGMENPRPPEEKPPWESKGNSYETRINMNHLEEDQCPIKN